MKPKTENTRQVVRWIHAAPHVIYNAVSTVSRSQLQRRMCLVDDFNGNVSCNAACDTKTTALLSNSH